MTALDEAWAAFQATRAREDRDVLVLAYRPLVRAVAGRMVAGMPSSVDVEDLASHGVFGLLDAIEKFDPARGVKFETYAVQRIRGKIIDELRELDWAPRSVRSKARQLEAGMERLEHELGRAPVEEELATAVGMTVEELRRSVQQVALTQQARLDAPLGGRERAGGTTVGDMLVSKHDVTLSSELAEAAELLAEGIAALGSRERAVLSMYYLEGLTLADIGKALSVSQSRVSQLHTRATVALQRVLAGQAAVPY